MSKANPSSVVRPPSSEDPLKNVELQAEIARYLEDYGFSGNITINNGPKNLKAIRKLIKRERFYTFGIHAIETQLKQRRLKAKQVRDILIEASGLNLKRFRHRGAGYFDPHKSAGALVSAMSEIKRFAQAKGRIVLATGHPGSLVGFYYELAGWIHQQGGQIVGWPKNIGPQSHLRLDMIGPVFVPSDNCSAWHSHEPEFMNRLLSHAQVDLVVGDHGFVGSALNHGISSIGFYDTDDPAMPLAQALGLPVIAVPINDNNYNYKSAELARYLIQKLG